MTGVMIGNGYRNSLGESDLFFFDEAINEFHYVQNLKFGAKLRVKALHGVVSI